MRPLPVSMAVFLTDDDGHGPDALGLVLEGGVLALERDVARGHEAQVALDEALVVVAAGVAVRDGEGVAGGGRVQQADAQQQHERRPRTRKHQHLEYVDTPPITLCIANK